MQSTLQRTGRSFQEIYEIYLPMVYRIAYTYMKNPYDSEDAAHETFLRLLRQTKPFQSQEHCKRWLIVTVTNVCRDLLRKKSRTELDLEEYRDLAAPEAKRDELLEEILRLPDKYKTAVYLHYYEGYPMELVTLPTRVMVVLGIQCLFVSNAAGGVNYDYKVGDLMIIKDHICQQPNPLIGPNMDEFGPRFPDMTRPYDLELIARAEKIAAELGIKVHKGVYYGGTGPTYETPSEYKYIRIIGGDVTGMSTIPEVIVARHADVPVFGMSVITNEAHDDYAEDYVNDGDDVVKAADAAAVKMTALFEKMIEAL